MMPLYPVYPHPLLSKAARALGAEVVNAETLTAETALDLLGTNYQDDLGDRIKGAVVRQVNLQVRESTRNPDIQSESRGSRSVTYVVRNGQTIAVDTLALATVKAVAASATVGTTGGGYKTFRGWR